MKRPPRPLRFKSKSNESINRPTPLTPNSRASSSSQSMNSAPKSRLVKDIPLLVEDDNDNEEYTAEQAIEEAQAVMNSPGYQSGQLSSFNLLEVVTNPRGVISLPPPKASLPSSSRHGITGSGSGQGNEGPEDELSIITSTSLAVESINNLTYMLDSFSREYFGSSPMDPTSNQAMEEYEGWFYDGDAPLKGAALEETLGTDPLPDYLANVNLQGLEDWLNHCCGLAFRFVARGEEAEGVIMDAFDELDDMEQKIIESHPNDDNSNPNDDDDDDKSSNDTTEKTTSEQQESNDQQKCKDLHLGVPPIFFSPYFDLTDPKTFESLLLDNDSNDHYPQNKTTTNDDKKSPTLSESMLLRQDNLSAYLDTIEMSLLNQVRIKSHQFFRETDNFHFLKKQIVESVQQVQQLRQMLARIKAKAVSDVGQIPKMDNQRQALTKISSLLEKIKNVVEAKASVAGLMAAEDYLGVVEAFQMSRSLLDEHHLSKISALAQVKDQFSSYEAIVVENMSTALVEHFLSWSSAGEDEGEEKKMMEISSGSREKMNQVQILLQALQKLKKIPVALDLYEVRLADMIKVTVKTTVTECAADASAPVVGNAQNNNNFQQQLSSFLKFPSVTSGVTNMTFAHFLNCLDMLFEQLLCVLRGAVKVDTFLKEEGIELKHSNQNQNNQKGGSGLALSSTASAALSGAAELAHKSISDLLRVRKDAHSLISLDEMKNLWDSCLTFTLQLEKCSHGNKAYGLRSTLLSQAKSFLERQHESCMARLVAALDSEKWVQCDVSKERQDALTRLCSGRAVFSKNTTKVSQEALPSQPSKNQSLKHFNSAYIDETPYKMVWSCLLLLEFLLLNVSSAAHFQTLATNCVSKISDLLRLFNSRSSQLVLGAGAIHSSARLKSINAKHLALVTQCLGLVVSTLPHIRAALMAQLPSKQHTLLHDLDKIKREYNEHLEKVLSKFVSIISGIVEHGLAPRITSTDFDQRGKMTGDVECCAFLEGVSTNTRKMHQVIEALLPPDHLQDVFSRIFANIDQIVPILFMNAHKVSIEAKVADQSKTLSRNKANSVKSSKTFVMPTTKVGKHRMIQEVEIMTTKLKSLPGVKNWEFTCISVLKTKLELETSPLPEGRVQTLENTNEQKGVGNETIVNGESVVGKKNDNTDCPIDHDAETNANGQEQDGISNDHAKNEIKDKVTEDSNESSSSQSKDTEEVEEVPIET